VETTLNISGVPITPGMPQNMRKMQRMREKPDMQEMEDMQRMRDMQQMCEEPDMRDMQDRQDIHMPAPEMISDRETGQLPCAAPLASAYVPFQKTGSKRYPQNTAIVKGTLYPSLNFPWKNRSNMTPLPDTPKGELMSIGFALLELALYLDTHPGDTEAIQLHNMMLESYKMATDRYEAMHGPLTHAERITGNRNPWIKSPWPWEIMEREG